MVSIGGHTVLHLASANRHCDVVKRLVEAGARVNVRNAHGNTPLHSAAATGTVDVLLVSCCASILAHSFSRSSRLVLHGTTQKDVFRSPPGRFSPPPGCLFSRIFFFFCEEKIVTMTYHSLTRRRACLVTLSLCLSPAVAEASAVLGRGSSSYVVWCLLG